MGNKPPSHVTSGKRDLPFSPLPLQGDFQEREDLTFLMSDTTTSIPTAGTGLNRKCMLRLAKHYQMEQGVVIQGHKVVGLPLALQISSGSGALSIPQSLTVLFLFTDASVSLSPKPADHHCDIPSS